MTKKDHRWLGTAVWVGGQPRQAVSEDLSTRHFGPVAVTVAPLAREEAQDAWNSPSHGQLSLGVAPLSQTSKGETPHQP